MRKFTVLLLLLPWLAHAETNSEAEAQPPLSLLPNPLQQQLLTAAIPQAGRGISAHEPVYFLLGDNLRGKGDYGVKFQISLKYRLLNPAEFQEQKWWERFYFGYTQTSLMDLEADSSPFRDSAYRPEMFWDEPDFSAFPALKALAGMRFGIGHESNGKDGSDSRSIDVVYVRPIFTFASDQQGYVWSVAPKLYAYIDKVDNPDIADYRGYGDFVVKLKKDEVWEFSTVLRKGVKDNYGSTQVDMSYPFRGFLRNLNGYLYLQYFNGYGETILDYNRKQPSRFGIGVIIVR